MDHFYTNERNVQIILDLLKAHRIRKVVASPGATNITLVASMQHDSFFELYSSVDERSAAYIACGLAAESGESVVLSCTGATASRNYMPGLTEAYYRKLPILAITSTQNVSKIGHLIPQVIDRRAFPNDIVKLSVDIPIVKDDNNIWDCEIKVNKVLLELKSNGGGPVHINLVTDYSSDFSVKELPKARMIDRVCIGDEFPELPVGRIGVYVGSHSKWTKEQINAIDGFCASNNAVVFCDHTSNYKGQYRMLYSLVIGQEGFDSELNKLDLLIHIGEVSGDYSLAGLKGKFVWRVNEDGEIRDTFQKLRYVFKMTEQIFFEHYIKRETKASDYYLKECQALYNKFYTIIPELPFSNVWIASRLSHRLPENSAIHLGILNSLRSWNFFDIPQSVLSYSNVGGFGIDGGMSSLVGASLANKSKLYFGVLGDLAFFYDMNVLGNRHIGKNLRILLINNGKGTEFRNYNHPGAAFGNDADEYIAAAGHYGSKSASLVKHYAEDLGLEYLSASNKQEFEQVYERFLVSELTSKSMLFEVFTDDLDESNALKMVRNLDKNAKGRVKLLVREVLGKENFIALKRMINK